MPKLPNSVDRSVNMRELIVGRQEHREKKGRKKERTGQPKLTFKVNKQVHLQDQKTERWNVQGVVKDGRISEEGTILSYNIILSNIHITNRHRRFIRKEILNGDTDIPDAAGLDRLEGTAGFRPGL